MNIPRLPLASMKDPAVQEAFRRILDFLTEETPILGFHHYELVVDAASTGLKVPHGLGYAPKDIILTSSIGAGAATFKYDQFDATNLVVDTTGACTIRFFAGTSQSTVVL